MKLKKFIRMAYPKENIKVVTDLGNVLDPSKYEQYGEFKVTDFRLYKDNFYIIIAPNGLSFNTETEKWVKH